MQMNFPFIIKFYKSIKLDYEIFFIEEYVMGLNLYFAIRDIGILNNI